MARAPCRHCGNEIDARIQKCPYCGIPRPVVARPAAPPRGRAATAVGAFSIVAGLAGLVVIGALVFSGWDQAGPEHDGAEAWTVCKQAVERRLVAPRTAKWPWNYNQHTTELGGGRYRVDAHVDAQNAFGAMIRNRVHCMVRWISGDQYIVETVEVTPWAG